MSIKNILLRALLYIGLALSFLAVMAVVIFVSRRTGFSIPIRWIGLAVFTGIIGWFIFHQYHKQAKKSLFWLTAISIMVLHLLVFWFLLTEIPNWPLVWFLPTTFVEVASIVVIMEKIFHRPKRRADARP